MGVIIIPANGPDLRVSGDINARVSIPLQSGAASYAVALSDGTMLSGEYQEGKGHALRLGVQGDAIISPAEDNGVFVDWSIEWLTISPSTHSMVRPR